MSLIGEKLLVRFWDHAEGDDLIEFCLVGKCARAGKHSISIDCWYYADDDDYDDNVQRYTIARSCICEIQILRPSKKK